MKKLFFYSIFGILFSLVMIGCGGGGGTTTTSVDGAVTQKDISSLKLVDVSGKPLVGAVISVQGTGTATKTTKEAVTYTVGADGTVTVDTLSAGTYTITISIGGETVTAIFVIGAENYQSIASVMAGLSVVGDTVTVINGAVIASLSGTVTDTNNVPIANAQVSISGGTATNGAFSSAVTNANGFYELFINLNETLVSGLSGLGVTASADGYTSKTLTAIQVLSSISEAGLNFKLEKATATTALYSEDFESTSADSWVLNKLTGDNVNNMWHLHGTSTALMTNKAYTGGYVSLAPNDTSAGAVPAPLGGRSFWYGNGVDTEATFGNFIGTQYTGDTPLHGGTSTTNNSGELISPSINLSAATGAINLTFDTYWEIESVNPNAGGYDLMTVSASSDGGTTWKILARLNPLSDPVSTIDRAPVPFSNTGFNSAPMWLTQEGITLIDSDGSSLAGKTIKLKFTFATVDGLYNGFRGWMVDNIKINAGEGTFPAYVSTNDGVNPQKTSRVSTH